MQKANLFIVIALLVTAAAGLSIVLFKRPPKGIGSGGDAPLELQTAMFRKDSLWKMSMFERLDTILKHQVSVQRLNNKDSSRLGIDEVKRLPSTFFDTVYACCDYAGGKGNITWLRFCVANRSADIKDFLVELVNPNIDSIQYYMLNPAGKIEASFTTGAKSGFGSRPEKGFRNFLFPANNIANGDTKWFYFRIESESPLHLRILFFSQEERLKGGHQQWIVDILMTIFYVFSALFLILLAVLITATKEPFHWYYFGYVLLTALFIPAHLGLGFMYVWPNNGDLQHIVPMALNNLRLVFGIQFFRLYFDLPKIAPRFNRFIGYAIGVFLFILFFQITHVLFPNIIFRLFFGFLILFSLVMLAWLLREMFFKRHRRFSWLLPVIALNFIGVGITSFQYLGNGSSGFDVSDRFLALFGIANTFFLSPFVIAAFFLEMVLVFNFAVRRYLRLIDINQKTQLRIARDKEDRLNALILAAENERKRIARDLHDGACVNLAAINMKVDTLKEGLTGNPALAQKMADIAEDLEQTYHELRGISHDLMSKTLDTTGLQTALEELAVRIQQAQKEMTVQFYSNYPLDRVNDLAKIHIYRIAQELLLNVLKHAKAATVNLQLLEDKGNLLLTVEDDGRGFDIEKALSNGGIGLSNVRTRVEVLHGKMHLDSSPEKGAFISIEIPRASLAANQ